MKSFSEKSSLYFMTRTPKPGFSAADHYLRVRGKNLSGMPIINVDDNDYLRLGDKDFSWNKSSNVMMSGTYIGDDGIHGEVAQKFAHYLTMSAATIVQSGFVANEAVIQAIATKNTPIYIDEYAHASFISGIKVSNAKKITFRHNSIEHLEELIKKHGPGVIAVDSLYSAVGTFAPLKKLEKIAQIGDHILVVDESHSIGLYGPEGAGLCVEFGIVPDFITASLAKSFATRAGLIATKNKSHTVYIMESTLPLIFSSVITHSDVLRISNILDIMKSDDGTKRRARLMDISSKIRQNLKGKLQIVDTPMASPIVCLIAKNDEETIVYQHYLQSRGIIGATFIYPATPITKPLIRLSLHSDLTDEEVSRIIQTVEELHNMRIKSKL